jgi:DNA repair exonuclease SbcCD ATPase subunit
MITFETIRWKNFLSTGNNFIEISLNKKKTTLISGENGAGKTTLLDALAFVLFGKPYRNVNIDQIVNSINQKDCVVEIEFSIGSNSYKVRRGLKPKIFEIYRNDELIDQESKAKDYQRMFEETILKMNYKSFCQVVILGSTNYVPFMRLSAAERRDLVEELLDINIFSNMNTVLKSKLATCKENLKDIDHNIAILNERKSAQGKQISVLKEKTKQSVENYQKEIEQTTSNIEEYESQNSELKVKIQEIQNKRDQLEKVNISDAFKVMDAQEDIITDCNKQIKFYQNNSTCTLCKQNLCEEHKVSILSELNEKVKTARDHITKIEKVILKIKKVKETDDNYNIEMNSLEREVRDNNNNISACNQYIRKLQKQISDLQVDNLEDEEEKMKAIEADIQTEISKRKTIEEEIQYLAYAAFLMKDSGIKSKIIKYYLPIMNKTINKYLSNMDFFVKFELDETFSETIKSRHRDIFTYDSFSEGEKRRIDLSLLFAWRAVAQQKNSLNCNLLIFDEVLDGSLDDTATEYFLNILKNLGKNTNVFVISHKSKEVLQDKFVDHITFYKKNNFTKLLT